MLHFNAQWDEMLAFGITYSILLLLTNMLHVSCVMDASTDLLQGWYVSYLLIQSHHIRPVTRALRHEKLNCASTTGRAFATPTRSGLSAGACVGLRLPRLINTASLSSLHSGTPAAC